MATKREQLEEAQRVQHKIKSLPTLNDENVATKKRKLLKAVQARIQVIKDSFVGRAKPKVVYENISPNQSSRGGEKPRLIVIHDTESPERKGKGDLIAVTDYLARLGVYASTHVVTDGDGLSARSVKDGDKAWHCASYNGISLGIEQIGYASRDKEDWPDRQLKETARWVAKWSKKYGIPIEHISNLSKSGVVTHAQLGAAGGGHHDPGPGYPMRRMLRFAREFRAELE